VASLVTDAKLVEQRRGQILRAAVKLFSDEAITPPPSRRLRGKRA